MASGSAGSIYVDLLLRDANFRQGLTRSERYTKRSTSNMSASFSSLGKVIAGVAGGLTAGTVFTKFIQNTIAAQNEQAQLAAVLKSTGNAAGFTISQLNAMANTMSAESIFSPGQINNAQTRLLSYAGVLGENIPRAMQSVIDQSARLGISLEQSAETVGRALEQPSKAAAALSRQGFGSYFTKDVVEMLKALEQQGRTAEAQVKILEVLEESYAGAAKAARETLGGALTNLKNKFDSMLVGGDGLNAASQYINILADNLDKVGKSAIILSGIFSARLVPGLISNAASFAAATQQSIAYQAALARMAGVSRAAAISTTVLGGALSIVGGPVGAAFLAAAGAVYYFSTRMSEAEKIAKKFPDIFKDISEQAGKAVVNQEAYNKALNVEKLNEYNNALNQVRDSISKINNEIGNLGWLDTGFFNFGESAKRSIDFRNQVDILSDSFKSGKIDIDQYNLAIANLAGKYPEFEKANKRLADQITALRTALNVEGGLTDSTYGPFTPKGWVAPSSLPIGESEKDRKRRESEAKKRQQELEGAYQRYEHLIRGVSKEVINLENVESDLNKLRIAGRISQDEMTEALKRYESELKKTGDEADQFSKTAAENIQNAFADFLFDPFEKGLDGMLKSFGDMILKMIAEAQAAQLARYLFGDLVSGGEGSGAVGGFFKGFFDSFAGGFANGGTIPAGQWGIVGERGPELAFGGNTGQTIIPQSGMSKGGVTVNVINNSGASVKTSSGTNGADLDVIIDQAVARNIGQSGTSTNSALSTYMNRSLTVR